MDLISLLVLVVILGVVFWLGTYIVDQLPMPAPFKVAGRVIVALIVLLVLLRRVALI
jgi:putative effector of murein hydrolase LrgA (UPF0299 family)